MFYQFFFCYHRVVHWHNLPLYDYITVQMFSKNHRKGIISMFSMTLLFHFFSLLILDKHLFFLYSTLCLFHVQFHVRSKFVCFQLYTEQLFILVCDLSSQFVYIIPIFFPLLRCCRMSFVIFISYMHVHLFFYFSLYYYFMFNI